MRIAREVISRRDDAVRERSNDPRQTREPHCLTEVQASRTRAGRGSKPPSKKGPTNNGRWDPAILRPHVAPGGDGTGRYAACWIAESSQSAGLPPFGRRKVHTSVTSVGSVRLPDTTRPVAASTSASRIA